MPILYQSPSLEIERYDCMGRCHHEVENIQEEASFSHEIVLPLFGLFLREDSFGKALGDSQHLHFFNRHQPHCISHPVIGRDACLILRLDETVLFNITEADNEDSPFKFANLRLNPKQQWQKYHFLNQVQLGDSLATEEETITWLTELLASSKGETSPQYQAHELVNEILLYLHSNYCEAINLKHLAEIFHYSEFRLCRLFKQTTGTSLHQHLSNLRLSAALESLQRDKHTSLSDLALNLGYNSLSHFSAAFKQVFSISPSKARRYFSQ